MDDYSFLSSDFNKFLSLQLKTQKAREGFDVKLIAPVELDAILYLTYDLQQFILKPNGKYTTFDAIVIPIFSIISLNTTEPTTAVDSNPEVHLRLTLPPFAVSIAFPTDCRSFSSFLETLEFLRMTLNQSKLTPAQREIHELVKTNEILMSTIESLRSTKQQQEEVIQELAQILKTLTVPPKTE
ncbi:hypothetical protein GPJ56_005556 [Histomonas meleagridis]|uniref:uncharacterized protein n=1 Tax=Histomonas meleagridis TaxID=135588 RepID=UPI00355A3B66|nr:hypothetical protein GPJ56_005556 [Histomonas meleagridis]KAH0799608.1 hypothetical protein GO595_007676 [Histomonas meleagridis]